MPWGTTSLRGAGADAARPGCARIARKDRAQREARADRIERESIAAKMKPPVGP